MARAPTRRIEATVLDACAEPGAVVVRFATRTGPALELEDRLALRPAEEMSVVRSVGRLLRVLRAGRVKPPAKPYALGLDPARAADLVKRCRGAHVVLHVARRIEQELFVWTDAGVDRIRDVLDVTEEPDGLRVMRRGGRSAYRIPRASMIRFETRSHEYPEIVRVEPSTRSRLH